MIDVVTWIKTYALRLVGGLLAVSLLGNFIQHEMLSSCRSKKAEIVATVKAATTIAKKEKEVVERRQNDLTVKTQDSVSRRIASVTASLLPHEGVGTDLPGPPRATSSPEGTSQSPELLSARDKLVCTINTILAEEWQRYYLEVLAIREEETKTNDIANATGSRIPRELGRVDDRGLQGLRRGLDVGAGSDEPVIAPGLPSLQGQPSVTR